MALADAMMLVLAIGTVVVVIGVLVFVVWQ
jgi:hypothetical protein